MNEHEIIRTYFAPLAGPGGLNLLDDAALLQPRAGHDLVLTKDSFVEGVHFPKGHYGGDTAERLLRTNLSDLAAKGARPIGYLLSLAIPTSMAPVFLKGFAAGLRDAQQAFDFDLLGGDTVVIDGPMVATATLLGEVPKGTMVQRSGASIGDDVWVTGHLGDAKLGCELALGRALTPAQNPDHLWQFESAYWRPEMRLSFRKTLRQFATAAADVSDGILADAGHIARASDVGLTLNFDALPLSNAAQTWADGQTDPLAAQQALLSFGDDYEIVFTAKPEDRQALFDAARRIKLTLSKIGNVHAGEGVACLNVTGQAMEWPERGHSHF